MNNQTCKQQAAYSAVKKFAGHCLFILAIASVDLALLISIGVLLWIA
jgi:hypothetical protein